MGRGERTGVKLADVYMKFEQISEGGQLLSAQTSLADKVELHAGPATTEAPAAIEILLGTDIDLDAGRGTLWLVNLAAPLGWGRSYSVTLVFEKSRPVEVMISVSAH